MNSETFRFGEKDGFDTADSVDAFMKGFKPSVSGLLPLPQDAETDFENKQREKDELIAFFLNKHFEEFPIGSADMEDEAASLLVGFVVWRDGVINAEADINDDRMLRERDVAKSIYLEDLGNYAKGRKGHFAFKKRTAVLGSIEKQQAHDNEELWGKIWDVASLAIRKSTRNH